MALTTIRSSPFARTFLAPAWILGLGLIFAGGPARGVAESAVLLLFGVIVVPLLMLRAPLASPACRQPD